MSIGIGSCKPRNITAVTTLKDPQHRPQRHNIRLSSMKQTLFYVSLVLLGAGTVVAGDRLLATQTISQPVLALAPSPQAISQATPSSALPGLTDTNFISNAVQRVGPAVVRINSSRTVARRSVPEGFDDPFFRRFFGSGSDSSAPPSSRVERGVGSGFILDSQGLILTNAHVVDGADRVTVTLKDGRTLTGQVLGEDQVTDVAVVKVDANNLPTIKLGNSDQLQPGEWAIAIGNPLGLDNTVTAGIISATGRSSAQVGVPDQRASFIQTDAAINPGNSGGPLLNQQGDVIGMNTAIRANAQGLGFAIPINTAKRIADQLIATGRVDHAYLGVQMITLTPELKENLNSDPNSPFTVQDDRGVLVVRVEPNSPAAKAGVRAGDVLAKVGQQAVTESEQVQQIVETARIGEDLPVELRRNGQVVSVGVSPEALKTQPDN